MALTRLILESSIRINPFCSPAKAQQAPSAIQHGLLKSSQAVLLHMQHVLPPAAKVHAESTQRSSYIQLGVYKK
jgi:hypothetical protein